jgi:diguanylate cyclase (GGDEF)-like protein
VTQLSAVSDADARGRLAYFVEGLATLHAAQDQAWLTGRFEFLGEKSLGAVLTALCIPDEAGDYRASRSASPRPAIARDLWERFDLDGLPANEAAASAFNRAEAEGTPITCEIADVFPGSSATAGEKAVIAPISSNRESIGAGLFIVTPDEMTNDIATLLANHAAVALTRLREREEARRLHSVDPRLWVPDEDFLVAQLKREVARARRYGREVGLALLRFDSEDETRAQFGDFYTNHLLRRVGGQLLMDVRDSDVIGALGGGYAVIHTETPLEGTQLSSERLRDRVITMMQQRFPELQEPRISVRVVAYPAQANTVEEMLDALTAQPGSPDSIAA